MCMHLLRTNRKFHIYIYIHSGDVSPDFFFVATARHNPNAAKSRGVIEQNDFCNGGGGAGNVVSWLLLLLLQLLLLLAAAARVRWCA